MLLIFVSWTGNLTYLMGFMLVLKYDYMNMHVHIDDGILELVSMNDSSGLGGWIISRPYFSVKAVVLGIATLYVSLQCSNAFMSTFSKL